MQSLKKLSDLLLTIHTQSGLLVMEEKNVEGKIFKGIKGRREVVISMERTGSELSQSKSQLRAFIECECQSKS